MILADRGAHARAVGRRDTPSEQSAFENRLFAVTLAAAFLAGLAHRLLTGWDAPLWLDETWTGVIASQPNVQSMIRWCLSEIGGPLYYSSIWAWARIAGQSDLALRFPSLVASLAAPWVAWRFGHPDPRIRRLWAGLLAVWLPSLAFASEARSYCLLVLLCTAQAIAYMGLIRNPGRRTALIWCGISALIGLTHYYGLIICGLQGLLFLAYHRQRAVAAWPAALMFVPVAAWFSAQSAMLINYAAGGNWYALLPPKAIFSFPGFLVGQSALGLALAIAMFASAAVAGRRVFALRGPLAMPAEALLVASGVGSMLVLYGLGIVRPSFSPRYLLLFGPATLFGVAWWACEADRRLRYVSITLLTILTALTATETVALASNPSRDPRYAYNFEEPSRWLASAGVTRLAFLWDNPTEAGMAPGGTATIGGYFLRRAGFATPVVSLRPAADADPNPLLIAAAPLPGDAILWAYDLDVARTRGIAHPSRLALNPAFTCRDFGRSSIHVIACIRRSGPLGS